MESCPSESYGKDIFDEVGRFTSNVLGLIGSDTSFDVIHAHDWMTYPAGVALAELTGKPLVVHVHSLEFDRSGAQVHPQIDQIERIGYSPCKYGDCRQLLHLKCYSA